MAIDFDELIHRQVESDTLDYKAHQSWSAMNAAARGKFIRHLAAFANTGGGCLVVGVGEDASGCPCDYTGLSDAEARSFDPSAVGAYVNRCVEPPIDFSLERPLVRGKRYAVFVVRPFQGLPHVCTRSVDNELQTGVFYIRTPDASSRPAHRALEMHRLIQRALRNQRELLAKMLRGILYESRTVGENADEDSPSGVEAADDAFGSALAYFRRRRSPPPGEVGMLIRYSAAVSGTREFSPERIMEAGAAASDRGGFITPEELRRANPGNVSWRYLSKDSPRMFQLFRRGWFFLVEYFPAPAGEVRLSALADEFSAFCLFAGSYYSELGLTKSQLELRIEASGLSGIVLCTGKKRFPPRTAQMECAITRSASDLGRDAAGYAARLLRALGESFNVPDAELMMEEARIVRRLKGTAQ